MNDNALTITVYTAGTNTAIADPAGDLARAEGLTFNSFYPGGIYGECQFFIPRDVTAAFPFKGGQRLVIRNGLTIVWEGALASVGYSAGSGGQQGVTVRGLGYWGWLLGARGIAKAWADTRLTDEVWRWQTGAPGADEAYLDRTDRIQFTGKAGVAWTSGDYVAVRYTAPTGHTIKRITYNFDHDETGQAWEMHVYNVQTAANEASAAVSVTATGAVDLTLATPSQSIELRWSAAANQTPDTEVQHAIWSNIVVYTETGSINAQEVAKDIRALVTDLNSDETKIGALTLSLVPFVQFRHTMFADWLTEAVRYGDASFNSWAAYLDHSETATTPDGKPVLTLAQYPALTDYDYAVRIDEANLVPPFDLQKDTSGVYNWIVVHYLDLSNHNRLITPDDNANLKDTTSITAYGQREYELDAGSVSSTVATNLGRRFLAANKDPKFYASSPITVVGTIRAKNGQLVPVSQVRAGSRIKIENFLEDQVGTTGAGLTFIITRATYDDATETVSLDTGVPDDLALMVAQIAAGVVK